MHLSTAGRKGWVGVSTAELQDEELCLEHGRAESIGQCRIGWTFLDRARCSRDGDGTDGESRPLQLWASWARLFTSPSVISSIALRA